VDVYGISLEFLELPNNASLTSVQQHANESIANEGYYQDEDCGHYSGEFLLALLVSTMLLNHSTGSNVYGGSACGNGLVRLGVVFHIRT
jgi:hypothetical protein